MEYVILFVIITVGVKLGTVPWTWGAKVKKKASTVVAALKKEEEDDELAGT